MGFWFLKLDHEKKSYGGVKVLTKLDLSENYQSQQLSTDVVYNVEVFY